MKIRFCIERDEPEEKVEDVEEQDSRKFGNLSDAMYYVKERFRVRVDREAAHSEKRWMAKNA